MICRSCRVKVGGRSTEQIVTEVLVEHDSVLVNLADVYSKLIDEIELVRAEKLVKDSALDQLSSDYTDAVERVQRSKEVAKAVLGNAERYVGMDILSFISLSDDLYPGNIFKSVEDYIEE